MDYKYLLSEVKESGVVDIIAKRFHEMKYMGVMDQLNDMHKKRFPYTWFVEYNESLGERVEKLYYRNPSEAQASAVFFRIVKRDENYVRNLMGTNKVYKCMFKPRITIAVFYIRTTNNIENTIVKDYRKLRGYTRLRKFKKTYHI